MRFAYADPPYFGEGKRRYNHPKWDIPDNYRQFIEWLSAAYPDGWALSASVPSLRVLLPFCPEKIRIAAWVKPFAVFRANVNPAYAWEPILFVGGRKRARMEPTVRDWFPCVITLKKGLVGAKPEKVCEWITTLLGATKEDTFDDIFPGTGAFTRTWQRLAAA